MRTWMIIFLTVITLAGCQGGGTPVTESDDPAELFTGLPSPAALLAADQSRDPARSVSATGVFLGHQWDAALPHSDNVIANETGQTAFLPGRHDPLTYCIYRVTDDMVPGGLAFHGVTINPVYVDVTTGRDGCYVGFADFNRNTWVWLGVATEETYFDMTAAGLEGNDGPEFFVVINYSSAPAVVTGLHFTFQEGPPVTHWLYYTQEAVFAGEGTGIARVPVDGSAAPETVLTGITDTGYVLPRVRYDDGGDMLYYTKETFGVGDIYYTAMDGTGETAARTGAGHLTMLDWNPAGTVEFFLDGTQAWVYDHSSMAGGSVTPDNGTVTACAIDWIDELWLRAGYLVLAQPLPATNSGLYHYGSDEIGAWTGSADLVADNGTEQVSAPVVNRYRYANGEYLQGCWFVSNGRNPTVPADTTENIYIAEPDGTITPWLVDEDWDFGGVAFRDDGTAAAVLVKEPADPYYDIYLVNTLTPENWAMETPLVEADVWGDLEWYVAIP